MKHSLLPQLLLPLLLFTLGGLSSCSDMTDEDGNNALSSLQHAPPLVQEALTLLSNHSVRMVDTHSGDHIPPANRPRKSRAASNQETFTVNWEDFKVTRCFGQEVALIPLTRQTQTAFVNLTIQGRPKKSVQKVLSKLIIRRDSLSGGIIPVVGTYIYEKKYAAKYKELLDTLGYDFTRTGFTGYFIASRTDGTMLSGTRWDKGNVHFEFEANPVPIEQRDSTDVDDELHLFMDLKPASVQTRALTIDVIEDANDSRLCSFCHRPWEYCQCVTVTICKTCHKKKSECTCSPSDKDYCSVCNQKIVNGHCDCCPLCKSYPCRCNNGGSSGSDGNTSGGTQTGGGTSGGGTSGSGTSSGGGSSSGSQSTSYVTTPAKITSAAKSIVNNLTAKYGKKLAVCNFGVQEAFKAIFGSTNLPPGMTGRANDMAKAWANNLKNWQPISISEAQDYANQGYFVVAGYSNPTPNKSGHVVVVVPGDKIYSKRWGCYIPCTMDTGQNKRTSKTTLNYSFGLDKKNAIHFYYYKR